MHGRAPHEGGHEFRIIEQSLPARRVGFHLTQCVSLDIHSAARLVANSVMTRRRVCCSKLNSAQSLRNRLIFEFNDSSAATVMPNSATSVSASSNVWKPGALPPMSCGASKN